MNPLTLTTRRRTLRYGLAGLLAIGTLGFWGCGGGDSGYPDPTASITTTKTANALIEPATLKQWIDEGKVNNADPAYLDKVVVVTVATAAQYAAQHVPGSLLLDAGSQLAITRLDGVGTTGTEVLDGPSMDGLVQRMGVNGNTTVVFVASKGQNALNPARAYFTFRYWGFPRERLKVLNGGEDGWDKAATAGAWGPAFALSNAAAPTVAASTFTVRNWYVANGNSTANFGLRTAIGEMIGVVDRINAGSLATDATGVSILDVRGGNPSVFIRTAGVDDFAQYAASGTGNTSTYKPTSDLTARLASFGITSAKSMTYVYCASGHRASSVFFVLDGILGWPVSLYDGSWGQWSSYASTATANKVAAAWQTDVNSPGTTLNRSSGAITPAGTGIVLDAVANALYTSVTDARANQMLNEDKAYFTSGSSKGGSSSTGGGGSSSGC
ncbi:MAG: selenite/tellurite reduction operon rhodanese-like protein ExtH [Burkholderiaceae bacterium]